MTAVQNMETKALVMATYQIYHFIEEKLAASPFKHLHLQLLNSHIQDYYQNQVTYLECVANMTLLMKHIEDFIQIDSD